VEDEDARARLEHARLLGGGLAPVVGEGDAVDDLGLGEVPDGVGDGVEGLGVDVELERGEGLDGDGGFEGGVRGGEKGWAEGTGEEVGYRGGARFGLEEERGGQEKQKRGRKSALPFETPQKARRERGKTMRKKRTVLSKLALFFFPTSIHPSPPPEPEAAAAGSPSSLCPATFTPSSVLPPPLPTTFSLSLAGCLANSARTSSCRVLRKKPRNSSASSWWPCRIKEKREIRESAR
jgi:hypothetical protein